MGPNGTESSVIKPKGVNSKHSRVGIGTAARAVSNEEKYPKECKEDTKNKKKEKINPCWFQLVGLLLLFVV